MTAAAATPPVFPLQEFRLLGPIGKGEFGQVHRAMWMPHQIDVALKQVPAAQGATKLHAEQGGVRLQELVWRMYPDIVPRIYCDGVDAGGDYYIAMEFVRGESLYDILRRKRLTAVESERLTTIIASVLHRLHSFNPPILHSDLKPEHVLVLDDGSVRIIDFGIAKRPDAGAATHNDFLSVMYAAPERVEDEARNVHPSDDLWALGVMFFEMLAGCHPREAYRGQIDDAVRRDDLRTVATLLRERPGMLPQDCSRQLDAIVRKMLSPQPGHRYPGAAQVLEDLQRYRERRETVAWQQLLAAGQRTRVVARPASIPTLPVPPPLPSTARLEGPAEAGPSTVNPGHAVGSGFSRAAQSPVGPGSSRATSKDPGAAQAPVRRTWISRRSAGVVLRAIAALLVARFLIGEGVVWSRADRFRKRIATFDVADLPSIPPMVRSLRKGAVFGFAAGTINGPLSVRMMQLAEPTIADYRTDMPVAKLPQWKSASAALAIAVDAAPRDRSLRARARYVDGQLLRIDALGRPPDAARPILEHAVAAFDEAARLDPAWPDPYIGLAAVHAYGFRDVNAVIQDVGEAARRGFTGGKREHAEVADAFSYRADQSRAGAAHADGDERLRLLTSAMTDYQGCVDNYAGVTGFFNSDRNLDRCRRLHDLVAHDIPTVPAVAN